MGAVMMVTTIPEHTLSGSKPCTYLCNMYIVVLEYNHRHEMLNKLYLQKKEFDTLAKNQKSYTPEFKQQIVDLHCKAGKGVTELSNEYGIPKGTVST